MNKQEWLMERKNYLGGSDLGAIAGLIGLLLMYILIKQAMT